MTALADQATPLKGDVAPSRLSMLRVTYNSVKKESPKELRQVG